MLALLAALPLIGLAVFAGRQINAVADGQRDLAAIEDAATDLRDLIYIETALDTEIYWTEANQAVEEFGIPREMLPALIGIDIDLELPRAQLELDEMLATYDDPALTQAIEDARANPDQRTDANSALKRVSSEQLPYRIRQATFDLQIKSAGLPDGQELAQRADVLGTSNQLRSAFTTAQGAYLYQSILTSGDPSQAFSATAGALANYDRLAIELQTKVDPSGPVRSTLNVVTTDNNVTSILSAARTATASFDAGFETPSLSDPATLVGLATTFSSATNAADAHLNLVETAASDFELELDRTRAREREQARTLGAVTLVTVIATLLAVVAVTRAIVVPIRRLGAAAESIGRGDVDGPLELSGPVEIQAATLTLNQAAENLERAEAQAHALADGRLEDDSFTEVASGQLGQSLDAAVRRLKDSLTEREEFRQRLSREAAHDGLTGILNRGASILALENALRRSESSGKHLAVLFIDLDGFKRINDVHGHEAGDRLLIRVAQRLAASCRPNDRVGRLGGDEFLIVAEPVDSIGQARAFAERIRQAASAPLQYRGNTLHPSLSIGVAVTDGKTEADAVIREADYALFEAKKGGRSQTYCFDDALRARLHQEADLENAITSGLANDEFSLAFQPILCATNLRVTKFEALLRWVRPGIGNMAPDDFIPFAERSDLILDIDRWVINHGVRHLAEFARRPGYEQTIVAVNVSGRHLGRGTLYDDVVEMLQRWEVEPSRLAIEITESALLDDLGTAADTLRSLRELGVQIAIDDFGTGYTSLSHLRNLPADTLKIDRSFTQGLDKPDDLSLVRLITETGHLLGMEITVEGIETVAQQDLLRELGVDSFQGYLFGKPVSFEMAIAKRNGELTPQR